MSVVFEDFSAQVEQRLKGAALLFLEEAGAEVESGAKQRVRVDTGDTKRSYAHQVSADEMVCCIGSNAENAIWEEFGTGIYAEKGDGRKKVPWFYKDAKGKGHLTKGKAPVRPLRGSYEAKRAAIERRANAIFKSLN